MTTLLFFRIRLHIPARPGTDTEAAAVSRRDNRYPILYSVEKDQRKEKRGAEWRKEKEKVWNPPNQVKADAVIEPPSGVGSTDRPPVAPTEQLVSPEAAPIATTSLLSILHLITDLTHASDNTLTTESSHCHNCLYSSCDPLTASTIWLIRQYAEAFVSLSIVR